MNKVKIIRQKSNPKINISSAPDYKLENALIKIIESDIFKPDYKNVTAQLLFDEVNYEECINSLKKIQKQIASL
jgi:hypothetical protein